MKQPGSILAALAREYESTQAGRTGNGARDLILDYENFLSGANARDGDARSIAEQQLSEAAEAGLLKLVPHKRDRRLIQQIRFSPASEVLLYEAIGQPAPAMKRQMLAEQFQAAANDPNVPEQWRAPWQSYLETLHHLALSGRSVQPFSREDTAATAELLSVLPRVLGFSGESLLRFASCILCGNSKRLEILRPRLEAALASISSGKLNSLEQIGILDKPRSVLAHGPLSLKTGDASMDFGLLRGPFRISGADIAGTVEISTTSRRCLTVENEATFYELAKLQSGTLLIHTSYPGSATLALLRRLPSTLERWHFGDADPAGFDILRDLRDRTGTAIQSFHMHYRPAEEAEALDPQDRRRIEALLNSSLMQAEAPELQAMLYHGNKGRFEQESLGRPISSVWPFY